ncbi:MAG: surE [Clostridiaceae bacterium]|nr:surE [Clostridiaceae bacterium]
MRILITNDDGIFAPGINSLAKEISKTHEVIVVAPLEQRSAFSHSITIRKPIQVKEINLPELNIKSYGINGTPADCVRVALDKLISDNVDLVLSGINFGLNIGTDVLYSGTVSAAIEASLYNIPSIAVSQQIANSEEVNYNVAAKYASDILEKAKTYLKDNIVLNINVPASAEAEIKGIKVCRIGDKVFNNSFSETIDENGEMSLLLGGTINEEKNLDSDRFYLKQGYVTITPLHYDFTNYKILKEVESWIY